MSFILHFIFWETWIIYSLHMTIDNTSASFLSVILSVPVIQFWYYIGCANNHFYKEILWLGVEDAFNGEKIKVLTLTSSLTTQVSEDNDYSTQA